jgi:hemerythrin-like metal-binding protein
MQAMPTWHPGICLFNPELDAQHISLLVLGSAPVDVLETTPEAAAHCMDLLQDIATLPGKHHALEEALLEKNGCPNYADIRAVHARSCAMLAGMIEDVAECRVDRPALLQHMKDWMRCHMNQSDMAVRQYLRA